MAPENEIRALHIPAAAWRAACAAAAGQAPLIDEHAAALHEIGWLTPLGAMSPRVAATLQQHVQADIAFRVVALYRDLAHVGDVSIGPDTSTCSLGRFRVGPSVASGTTLAGADPDIEFSITRGSDPWPLIKRILPPFSEFVADPRQTPPGKVAAVTLDDAARERVRALVQAGQATPEHLRDAVTDVGRSVMASDAAVHISMRITAAERTGVSASTWLRGSSGGLYLVHVAGGQPRVDRMSPGAVGFEVAWLTLGALEAVGGVR